MKRFTVDVHWDFARSYEVDADNKEDAEHKVESMMFANNFNPLENGFEKIALLWRSGQKRQHTLLLIP